jgi:hypothetical protein
MSYHQLLNQAYRVSVKFKSHAIAHDLAYMTESELKGVINFLSQLEVE